MRRAGATPGVRLERGFVTTREREEALAWLATLHPLREWRFSTRRPLPPGEVQRRLQRPVYWLGNWQFACLGYWTPPHGTVDRCVRAEPFPDLLQRWVRRAEALAHDTFPLGWLPRDWHLNTCLVNFYGSSVGPNGKLEDQARVGAHRDHEPGPVASLSFGARALFQFTTRHGEVTDQTWLEDRELQLFAGPTCKERWFHRVQRVERSDEVLPPAIDGFVTRRVNLTLRYVPERAVTDFAALGPEAKQDVLDAVRELATGSRYWAKVLEPSESPAESDPPLAGS